MPRPWRLLHRTLAAALGVSLALSPLAPATALAEQCQHVDVEFTPADLAGPMKLPAQIVAWIERQDGSFVETVFITAQTGTFGLGNRPGRFDFNSGPKWPYGRRITVFPVWAHRYDAARATAQPPFNHPPFPLVEFRDGFDDRLSHRADESSRESHFCAPMLKDTGQPGSDWDQADAGTCASVAFTDKGVASSRTSLYPPRTDVVRSGNNDDPSVDQYASINPFDAISGATPLNNQPALLSWAIPPNFPRGEYVMWVEVSREFDHNATYSEAAFPAPPGPPVDYATHGAPYRGQPSILYRVPFMLGDVETTASTAAYAGYGDPAGGDGNVRAPDATITTTQPGSGAQRLALVDGYRVRVTSRPEFDFDPPAAPASSQVVSVTSSTATIEFVAPGDDGLAGKVKGYEVRMRADGTPITDANFADSFPIATPIAPVPAGAMQSVKVEGLLFETEYYVAVRAYDDCRNYGPLTVLKFSTTARAAGEVDACFVATAAYGSVLANDVEMLRRFRDTLLQRTVLGELAVEAYYTFGPAMSGIVGESDLLRATARSLLDPIVDRVRAYKH